MTAVGPDEPDAVRLYVDDAARLGRAGRNAEREGEHYHGHMGGLYGSEYRTYLLPRRVGEEMTAELTSAPFEPLGARRAVELGLIDHAFGDTAEQFRVGVRRYAKQLASSPARLAEVAEKRRSRARDEQRRPLVAYRATNSRDRARAPNAR